MILMHYVAVFVRYYFGLHCLASGANYYLHFSKTGKMLDPATIMFQQSIEMIGIYPGIKTLELVVGICLVLNIFVPLALILEFPVSVTIFVLALYQGWNIHLLTGFKEVALNAFLFAAYAGYYLQFLKAHADQKPLWDATVLAKGIAA
jgi:riboflavin transporter